MSCFSQYETKPNYNEREFSLGFTTYAHSLIKCSNTFYRDPVINLCHWQYASSSVSTTHQRPAVVVGTTLQVPAIPDRQEGAVPSCLRPSPVISPFKRIAICQERLILGTQSADSYTSMNCSILCNFPMIIICVSSASRNQGLMKRMYGDTRHISILKTEFEKNEIDVDDIEVAAARYSRNGQRREERKSKYAFTEHGGRLNDVLTEPHFRPTTMSTTTTRMKDSTTTTTTSQPSQTTPISPSEEEAKGSGPTESTSIPDLSVTLSYTDEVEQLKNKYDILSNEDEAQDDGSVETNSIYENTTEGHLAPPLSYNQEKLPQPSNNQTISMEMGDSKERLPISSTLKIVNPDPIEDFGDMIITESEGGFRESASVVQVSKEQNPNSSTTKNQHQPLDRVDDFSAESSEIYTDVKPSPPLSSQSQYGEEKSQTPLPQTAGTQQQPPTQGQTIMEGHLYQDSLQKNNNPPVMSGRGV